VLVPAMSPSSYFELAFFAPANVDHRLWIRGKADNNSWSNDSVYVQFSDSVNASGAAIWLIGTTSATPVTIENGVNAGLHEWGWNDNRYESTPLGPPVRFASSGIHTLRVQTREDGSSIDQIVLSASDFFSQPPGAPKDDTTLLNACVGNF
jgi:hypothetical protein